MRKVIQITDKILGVIVPSDAHGFFLLKPKQFGNKSKSKFALNMYIPRTKLSMSKFNFSDYTCTLNIDCNNLKIHGTCTLPAFDFDFEVDESWVEKKKFNKGVFIEDTYLYRDYLSSNENMCFVGLPEYECRVKSFKSKIQKAIQDEGMFFFFVNPYGEKEPELSDPNPHSQYYAGQLYEQERWQSSESKTVKKLLIIEKN